MFLKHLISVLLGYDRDVKKTKPIPTRVQKTSSRLYNSQNHMGQKQSVCIVGGGLAGLWLARELQAAGNRTVVLFERNYRLGGKVHTLPFAECGAFRVHESHARLRRLAEELGVPLARFDMKTVFLGQWAETDAAVPIHSPTPGQTWWDMHALQGQNMHAADVADAKTGYRGSMDVHSVMDNTAAASKDAWMYAPGGFESITSGLAAELGSGVARVSTLVTNVTKKADGSFVVASKNASGQTAETTFDAVVFACPPYNFQDFDVSRLYGKAVNQLVEPSALSRIYAKSAALSNRVRGQRVITASVLQQTIGVPKLATGKSDDWVQVSYSEGQVARFWNDLKLSDPARFDAELRKQVGAVFGEEFSRTLLDPELHFWERAVHKWKTAAAVIPDDVRVNLNRVECPNVYLAGEALSVHQGWMEGALETAAMVLDSILQTDGLKTLPVYESLEAIPRERGKEWVVVHGRVVGVQEFVDRHPGGRAAIMSHVYTDASHVWDVVHTTLSLPWRMMCSLQIAWVQI